MPAGSTKRSWNFSGQTILICVVWLRVEALPLKRGEVPGEGASIARGAEYPALDRRVLWVLVLTAM